MHPYRSLLYVPGSNARAIKKARELPADAFIFDLEDAVAPDEKIRARDCVAHDIAEGGFGNRNLLIRINGENTSWGVEDALMAIAVEPDGILLPKVESPEIIRTLGNALGHTKTRIWAMIETPLGVLNAAAIAAASPRLEGFIIGTNDLGRAIKSTTRYALIPAIAQTLLAARAYSLTCVDGVYNVLNDTDGLHKECVDGRDLGLDGKTLIHPSQIDIANEIFAPDPAQIALAHKQILAHSSALKRGEAVAVVDGQIVENLHVETAKRLIALDEAIKAMSK